MTLIVGILCVEGVVLAADGAATLGALGMRTVREPVRKLSIFNRFGIIGVSGPVGLGQRLTGVAAVVTAPGTFRALESHDAMRELRNKFWEHVRTELEAAAVSQNVVGPQVAQASCLCHTLLAIPHQGRPRLFQFDQQCAPEEASADLPFIAIGSGRQTADPFLAFLHRIFWPGKQPNLADGLFAALWTLHHAIETSPGGIAEPIQVVTLSRKDGEWSAREIHETELEEHKQAVKEAEGWVARFREEQTSGAPEPPPRPPSR